MRHNLFSKLKRFNNDDIEVMFEGDWYMATVSYGLQVLGEYQSWDYAGDVESEIVELDIHSVEKWDVETEEWVDVSVSKELEKRVLEEIEKFHEVC